MSESAAPTRPARRVHWLELFFDLVMVAYIGQIAHAMHGDPGWPQAIAFAALLATAWWAWVNATITMNLFGARITGSIWIAVTIAMAAIGVMAAAVPEALGDRAAAFALGNAAIRLVWAYPWFSHRRRSGLPWWRPMLYSVVPAALWIASVFAPPPLQWIIWAVAVGIEVVLLGFLGTQSPWLRSALDIDHLAERVGLLVVIVFGESVLSIVTELDQHWEFLPALTALLAFVAVVLLAWLFFTYATTATEQGWHGLQRQGSIEALRDTVMYLPVLLIAGVVLFAAALGTAVADAGEPLPQGASVALAAGVSLFFVSSAAEALRYGRSPHQIVPWAIFGVLAPWLLVPIAAVVPAVGVVAASVVLIAAIAIVNTVSVRRITASEPAVSSPS